MPGKFDTLKIPQKYEEDIFTMFKKHAFNISLAIVSVEVT